MTEKVVGYSLVIAGLCLILFAGFSVYQVFTAKQRPVDLFHFPGISINLSTLMGNGDGMTSEQKAALERQKAQVPEQEIVSKELLNDSSNLAAHMFLMGFLATIGFKIASLGVQFVRPIVVKVRGTTESKSVLLPN